ncbi:RING finger protein 34 [Mortierella sp. AD031]|nr:RING finger protein 34 [Mortierella sp. AD031]KAG0218272.1 RING finger protein 34 [Mortierella sp. NVP41]
MAHNPALAHSIPAFKTGAKSCARCGKDFHLFRSKKNCHNCVSKMDYAGLSNLNIKTLRGYLLSYNIPTQGMLEKQDLIRAIQSFKPIPEASEVYFRQHLPELPDKSSSSFFDELANLGRSESPSGSSQGSSSSGDGWSWDLDKFFSKLFSPDDPPAAQARPARPQSQSQPQSQFRPTPTPTQSQPRPPPSNGSTYRPQNTAGPGTNGSYRPNPTQYRPPPGNPPPTFNNQSRGPVPQPHPSQPRPPTSYQQAPRQPTARPPATPSPATPQHSRPTRPAQPPSLTLDQLMTSNTDPSTLSIKAIKTILDQSCVTYVGVIEKRDLVDRLQKLIDNTKAEQTMVQEQEAESKASETSKKSSAGNLSEDDNLCKICCDAALNCVMLNCNHMSTCMDCGKLIMEGSRMCPICREYVVKLLHVFRA